MRFGLVDVIAALILVNQVAAHAEGQVTQTCVAGDFHKRSPSSEITIREGTACSEYASLSCCTANTAHSIDGQGDQELYNFHWDDCGSIPGTCQKYLKAESCFFECDPYLGPWKGLWNGTVAYVPICASYCDQWFDACKNVTLCAANWITDFIENNITGRYHCINDTCLTFAQWYKNGKGLCETMWGNSFQYDADNDNCMVMMFTGNNPNANVTSGATHMEVTSGATTELTTTEATSGATHIVWWQHGLLLLYIVYCL